MNKDELSKFKIEKLFQGFFSCFPGMTDNPEVIDMLRDFFYAGAGEIMKIQIDPPAGMSDDKIADNLAEMYAEVIAYAALKEVEFYAENN